MRTLSRRSAGLRSKLALLPMGMALALASQPSHGLVDLPTAPLQSAAAIPSNILFLLDDSGSMQFEMMPEDLVDPQIAIDQLHRPGVLRMDRCPTARTVLRR